MLNRHMPQIALHFLNARGQLSSLQTWLEGALSETFSRSARLLPLGTVDVVVKAGTFVIPEKGHVGWAPEPGLIYLTVDPDHPSLRANEHNAIERMFAHELHHCARWDGPGYGKTLGDALTSEGLAGHFAQELYGAPPEPWECVPITVLRAHVADAAKAWEQVDYDHSAWFFGTGPLPRWLGYSLGYQIVARYLAAHTAASASSLVHAKAEEFRAMLGAV